MREYVRGISVDTVQLCTAGAIQGLPVLAAAHFRTKCRMEPSWPTT